MYAVLIVLPDGNARAETGRGIDAGEIRLAKRSRKACTGCVDAVCEVDFVFQLHGDPTGECVTVYGKIRPENYFPLRSDCITKRFAAGKRTFFAGKVKSYVFNIVQIGCSGHGNGYLVQKIIDRFAARQTYFQYGISLRHRQDGYYGLFAYDGQSIGMTGA
jgi:hypothetical protein